jgi:hypothetical protein
MDKADEYRTHAARAVLDAVASNDAKAKMALVDLARALLALADIQSEPLGPCHAAQVRKPYRERN